MMYRRINGSLRCLVHTRLDLAFSVRYVSRFMERPTVKHMGVVKRLLCLIAGTIDYGLFYPRGLGEAILASYQVATTPATLTHARAPSSSSVLA